MLAGGGGFCHLFIPSLPGHKYGDNLWTHTPQPTIPHNSNLLYCMMSYHTWSYQEHQDNMWTHHTITFLPIYHAWVAKHTNSVWLIISSIVLFFHLPIHYWLNSFIIILLASINNSSFYLPGHSKAFTCRVKNGGQLLPEMQLQIISATTHICTLCERCSFANYVRHCTHAYFTLHARDADTNYLRHCAHVYFTLYVSCKLVFLVHF